MLAESAAVSTTGSIGATIGGMAVPTKVVGTIAGGESDVCSWQGPAVVVCGIVSEGESLVSNFRAAFVVVVSRWGRPGVCVAVAGAVTGVGAVMVSVAACGEGEVCCCCRQWRRAAVCCWCCCQWRRGGEGLGRGFLSTRQRLVKATRESIALTAHDHSPSESFIEAEWLFR